MALAIVAAACTGSGEDETTPSTTESPTTAVASGGAQNVEFGSGSIPETLPAEFPVPDEAVIGTTLIDRSRNNTEVLLTMPADVLEVKGYYEENLPGRGFEVATSDGTDTSWLIEFSGGGGAGVIRISTGGAGVSVAAVQFTTA